jgi:hypothetical protein
VSAQISPEFFASIDRMLQYLFGGYIAGLVCLVFSIWWLRKTHPHQIYLIWLSFSFFFVVFLLVSFYTGDLGHYPIVKAAFDYLTDIDTEVKLVASAIALVIAPQALTYFLCGLSGSASPPKFVANVTDFMIWSLIKSLSACSGIFLAIFISGFWGFWGLQPDTKKLGVEESLMEDLYVFIGVTYSSVFLIGAAFLIAWVHVVAWQVVGFINRRKVFSAFLRVHEFFTRYSAPKARSLAQPEPAMEPMKETIAREHVKE